jgi:hypothetical protein
MQFRKLPAMTDSTFPLHHLLDEINKAATSGLPFLAVAMAVSLPDICVSLASQDGQSDGIRYRQWCKLNLGPEFRYVTSDDLWSMRCGVLHNGRFGELKHGVAKVIFMPSGASTLTNSRIGEAYLYSIVDFCKSFTKAVEDWFEKNKNDATVQSNLPRLMRWQPNGIAPYVIGSPVLA